MQRALHGVNLSGWLTLEPWVTPELFADSGALDEPTLIRAVGRERYHALVNRHRASFYRQADFLQIAARGFNAVRLPVPWYALGEDGPNPGPYLGCIDFIDEALSWAEDVGMAVILALKASPGNLRESAGLIRNQESFSEYRKDLLEVCQGLCERYALRMGFAGIELADDPLTQTWGLLGVHEGIPLHSLRTYYRRAYEVVRSCAGDDVLVVLPDAGRPDAWRTFMSQKRYHNVWLDCHLFHHADHIDAAGPSAVRTLVDRSRVHLARARKSGLPTMVGAWSAALPYADATMTPEGQIALARVYVSEQLSAFSSCPGWFFQTWKTSGRLVGWDARVALSSFERRMLD
jgi:glucan 1,3-beta-glucosidase